MNKICTQCHKEFPATLDYFKLEKRNRNGLMAECKLCYNNRLKKWRQTDNGKFISKLSSKRFEKTEKAKERTFRYHQTEKYKKSFKKYLYSDKGRINIRKKSAKRKLKGYIEITPNPFDISENIDMHHFKDNRYVVAIPKDLHQLYFGKFHKENLLYIVNQIYGDKLLKAMK